MENNEKRIELPDYDSADQLLARADAPCAAADLHGLLSGFVCAGTSLDVTDILEKDFVELGDDAEAMVASKKIFFKLFDYSSSYLHEMAFDFQLFLPSDEHALTKRSEALSQWCDGFLSGLGMAGITPDDFSNPDVAEAVVNIAEIAQIDHLGVALSEDDEKAFAEVTEYVRMAVLMIFAELYDQMSAAEEDDDDFDEGEIAEEPIVLH